MRYVTLEGRFKIDFAYHFNLLNHFEFLATNRINFPFFICNSIEYSIERLRYNIIALTLHESVILLA